MIYQQLPDTIESVFMLIFGPLIADTFLCNFRNYYMRQLRILFWLAQELPS
jgi:hypothetical protein